MATEEKPIHMRTTMSHGNGNQLRFSEKKWTVDHVGKGPNVAGPAILPIEGKIENSLEVTHRFGRGINGQIVSAETKRTQIVKPHDVIRMRMGIDRGVEAAQTLAQGLHAEVRSGIQDPGG